MKEPSSAVVHFYRAIVLHADVWRERLDATTNWAVVTTIGVVSFAFSRADTPHFILLFLIAASWLFLVMESRRYQVYDLWRRRIRSINQYIVAPRLAPDEAPSSDEIDKGLTALARDLGRAVPHLRFVDALGYRIRRNYGFIFLFTVGSWVLKLYLHPREPNTFAELVDRAGVATVSGTAVLVIVAALSVLVLFLALRAPSEQMVSWRRLPSPLNRLKRGSIFPVRPTEREERKDPFVRPGPRAPRPMSEFISDEDEPQLDASSPEGDDRTAREDNDAQDPPDDSSDSDDGDASSPPADQDNEPDGN